MDVTVLDGITSIEGVTWQSIDFTDSQLPGLRFSDCQIRNCIFDRCRLDDMRVWSTDFASVSFRFTDLRGTVLGGTTDNDNRRNTFHDCDFTAADMRGSIYGAAEFLRCKFNRAKLDKVDFQSSAFVDCSFEGELRDVVFCRKGFDCERFPPNEMKRVDLRRAKLRGTTFMGLDLDEVLFPEDEDHIVVDDFPQNSRSSVGAFWPALRYWVACACCRFQARQEVARAAPEGGSSEQARSLGIGRGGWP